jgi:hypothetical protein
MMNLDGRRGNDGRRLRTAGSGWAHPRPLFLLGGSVLFTAFLLLAPTVSATPVDPAPKLLTAPYTGTPLTVQEVITADCGTVHLSHGPAFNLASGVGRVEANASANTSSSCTYPVLPNEAVVTGFIGLASANQSGISGFHKVKATWDLKWTVNLKASGSGGNPGNLQTVTLVEVELEIVDVTADNGVAEQDWSLMINRTGDTSIHQVVDKNVTMAVNYTFNRTHVYSVLTVVEYASGVEIVEGAATGRVSASLNMATDGNKATLVSITPP